MCEHFKQKLKTHVKQLFITNYGTNQCDRLKAFFVLFCFLRNTQSAAQTDQTYCSIDYSFQSIKMKTKPLRASSALVSTSLSLPVKFHTKVLEQIVPNWVESNM